MVSDATAGAFAHPCWRRLQQPGPDNAVRTPCCVRGGERYESVPLRPALQVLHPRGAGFEVACWQTQSGLFLYRKKSARLEQDRPGPGGQQPDCDRLSNAAGNEQRGRCNARSWVTAGWTGMCASKRQMRNRPRRQRSDQFASEISKSFGRSSSKST